MTSTGKRFGWATDGERGRALAYVIVTLFGAALTFVIVTQLENSQRSLLSRPTLYEIWIIFSGGVGAIAGLFLSGELLGKPGRWGWLAAIRGALLVSFSGSLIAGTLALPIYGTMFAPFTLGVTLIGSPLLAVLWFGALFAAHYLMVRWRRERDSIFKPLDDLPRTVRQRSSSPLRKSSAQQDWLDDEAAALAALRGVAAREKAGAAAVADEPSGGEITRKLSPRPFGRT